MKQIKLGFQDYTALVFIPDPASTDGSGKTGLVAANLTVSYTRVETDNDVAVTDVTSSLSNLAALTTAHTDWGLLEVSSSLAPGLYRLDIADAVFASGAWSAVVYVMITTSAAAASPIEFILVAFDPLDTVRLGLTALPNAAAEAAGGLYTRGTGAGQINQAANGQADTNIVAISGDSAAADNLESYTDGTTPQPVNATQLSGDATAADNAEAFFDGTGYAGTNNVIPTVTTVNGLAANTITAASIATDAITAAKIAADAVAEIQSGLATAAALDAVDNFIDTEIAAIITTLGTAGAGLTAIPWNAAWDAEVQSEVDDALVAQNLDHLVKIAVDTDFATTVHLNSVVGHLADNGTSATFDRTTDSLEALEGKIDAIDNFIDAEVASILAAVDTEVGAIKTVTDALPNAGALTTIQSDLDDIQTRLPAALVSGRMDASVGAMAADVITASAIATDAIGSAELAASAVTEIQTGLSTLTAAQVNAEVLDVLNVDTFAQPGQENPAATTTLANMLRYLYKAFRNKKTQTATTMSLFADDAATVDQKATISDDGTTYTHSEISTGP